jgi:hypothetical protein
MAILVATNPLGMGNSRHQVGRKFMVAYRFVQVANWEIPLLELHSIFQLDVETIEIVHC